MKIERKIKRKKERQVKNELLQKYAFDFEATTKEPVTAYLFTCCDLSNINNCYVGYSVADCLDYMFNCDNNSIFYAHNLTYDYSLIKNFIEINGLNITTTERIIAGINRIIKVTMKQGNKRIELRDSYVLFMSSLDQVMKSYTDLKKGETPLFETFDNVIINEDIIEYAKNDAIGLAKALIKRLDYGCNKITIASGSWAENKRIISEKYSEKKFDITFFPSIKPAVDKLMRKSYKGGFTYVNPEYINKIVKNVSKIDVNSMYPAIMHDKILPYGDVEIIEHGYIHTSELTPLGIQRFSIKSCFLKDGYIPFLSNGGTNMFGSTIYLDEIDESESIENRTFFMTIDEFKLFKKSYVYKGLKCEGGYRFKGRNDLFIPYITYFSDMKKSDDLGISTTGKYFLNALYGKFAENPEKNTVKIEYDNKIKFVSDKIVTRKCGYLPVGIFITSYARVYLIESILKIGKENFIYCDTDSIHFFEGADLSKLEIDAKKFGAWKEEDGYLEAKYLRTKRYCGIKNGKVKPESKNKFDIACAGIKKKNAIEQIKSIDDFYVGKEVLTFEMKQGYGGMYSRDKIVRV